MPTKPSIASIATRASVRTRRLIRRRSRRRSRGAVWRNTARRDTISRSRTRAWTWAGGSTFLRPRRLRQGARTERERTRGSRKLAASSATKRLFGAVHGEQLSRVPKGFCADHPAADLLRFKQFLLFTTLDPALVTTPKLFVELEKRFRALTPFLEFLNAPLVGKRRLLKPPDLGYSVPQRRGAVRR